MGCCEAGYHEITMAMILKNIINPLNFINILWVSGVREVNHQAQRMHGDF